MKKYTINQMNDYSYSIKISGDNTEALYESIIQILQNGTFYDDETESIWLTAEKVETLKEYLFCKSKMSQGKCIQMIDKLTNQIANLQNKGYGFYGCDIDDIIVINNNNFVICSAQYLLPIVCDMLIFYSPITKPYFGSPELLSLTRLPAKIDYKGFYYSLGILLVYCLLNVYLLVGNEIKDDVGIEMILKPIQNTKIYWFLKRCLNLESDKRQLLLI